MAKPVANAQMVLKVVALASALKSKQSEAEPLVLKASDDACLIAAATLLAANEKLVSLDVRG